MKILARQLTVDMYDCKNKDLSNYEDFRESLDMAMNMAGYTPIEVRAQLWNEEQAIVFILLQEGHAVVRTYPKLKYVASDVFICQEDGKPEKAIKALKKLMKPEKIRMTYLKRGDFGTVKDVKPRIKIRIAPLRPLRSIKNKGAKVIKTVARRIKL